MKLVQQVGGLEQQFLEITRNAIDKRQFADVTTPGSDVEFEITHGLGYIPLGYLVISSDKAGHVYNSTTAWTAEKIYLKCNVSTTIIRVLIF